MFQNMELAVPYLIQKTKYFVEPLNKFRDIALVPCGMRGGDDYPKECRHIYEQVVNAIKQWVKMILNAEVMLIGTTNTSCKLLLLEGKYLSQSVDYKLEGECNRLEDNILITPIGTFSGFMYKAIMEIPNNPVKMFYEIICKAVEVLRDYDITFSAELLYKDRYLVRSYVKRHGLGDELGVCDFDVIADSIKAFLSPTTPRLLGNVNMYWFTEP